MKVVSHKVKRAGWAEAVGLQPGCLLSEQQRHLFVLFPPLQLGDLRVGACLGAAEAIGS